MADVFTKAKRSEVMSRIRSRGNRDMELALARLLRVAGICGWRRHLEIRKAETGKQKFKVRPDFVFRQVRLALFVDGCFWHGCPKHATKPANNRAFWRRKLAGNKKRDALVTRTLRRAGWRVVRIWEHELAKAEGPRKRLRLTRWGTSNNQHSTSNIQCRQTDAADPAGA
jgi:DNA mismatch endonuclease, patch repair protein